MMVLLARLAWILMFLDLAVRKANLVNLARKVLMVCPAQMAWKDPQDLVVWKVKLGRR